MWFFFLNSEFSRLFLKQNFFIILSLDYQKTLCSVYFKHSQQGENVPDLTE